jgi:CBS domain-containing protein
MSDNSDLNSVQGLLTLPVSSIIDLNVGLLESDKTVAEAITLMKSKGLRSVLALHNGEVVGIVTKTDVLFKIMSQAFASIRGRPKGIDSRSTLDDGQTRREADNSQFRILRIGHDIPRKYF